MSELRNDLIDNETDRRQLSWKRRGQLAAILAIGVFGAGAALAAIAVHPAKEPGPGACAWGALKGNLGSAPKFVLAFDNDFNVQPHFRGGGGGHPIPPGSKEEPPAGTTPDANARVELERFGASSVICVKMNGDRKCFETG